MSDIICITDRSLCGDGFILQMEKIAAARPDCIILREKDLDENSYFRLAETISEICKKHDVPFSVHFYCNTAINLNIRRIHVPLFILRQMKSEEKQFFSVIGVSCHSAKEALEAQSLGASYITAGHIFQTNCKAGLAGRGLDFLRKVRSSVQIPVYAIGGITPDNAAAVVSAGADGLCIMSGFMKSSSPADLISDIRKKTE